MGPRNFRNANCCNESFNQRWTLEQLVQIHRVFRRCGWDIYPDAWTPRQVREALAGVAPQWDEVTERPVYDPGHGDDFTARDEQECTLGEFLCGTEVLTPADIVRIRALVPGKRFVGRVRMVAPGEAVAAEWAIEVRGPREE